MTFHRHLPVPETVRARPQAILTGISPRPLRKGADESDVSSSPSGTRNCASPSAGHSHRHISAPPPRRCRRKRHFIVTFRHTQLCVPVHRCFCRPYLHVSFQKVPTKVTFHRHLPAPETVRARPQAILTGISPRPLQEGADESGISSSPSGTRSYASPSTCTSAGHTFMSPCIRSAKELSSDIKILQKMIGKSPGELPPKVSLPGPNPSFPGGLDVNWKCPHAPFLQDSIHQVFAESARGYLNSENASFHSATF